MVTFVGKQDKFVDALKELVELEYAAVEAYDTALDRLESSEYKSKCKEFQGDHERCIKEISDILGKKNEKAPQGPNLGKELITKGKVLLANMVGDLTILSAIRSNETDANKAYERLNNRIDIWPEVQDLLKNGLQAERAHNEWLNQVLA